MRYFGTFALVAIALFIAVGCDEDQPASSAKPTATPKAAPTPAPTPEKPKPVAKAKPKKTAADCPKGNKVVFDDPKVEEEVRRKLEKPSGDVTHADLGRLKSLNLSQLKIDQLDPCIFPYAKNLKELFLGPGKLDDLSSLAGMTHLESLRASINQVRDIRPLAKMTKLDRLDLGRTQVTDLGPLRDLRNLTELAIDDTPVRDLGPLSKLDKLERLSVKRTMVKDFSPLKDLKNLKFLYVAGTPGTDISVLQPLRAKGLRIIDH